MMNTNNDMSLQQMEALRKELHNLEKIIKLNREAIFLISRALQFYTNEETGLTAYEIDRLEHLYDIMLDNLEN